jgi:hypothetical protein
MDTCDQSFYVLFIMLWSYYYFEVTSPASGFFFGDSIRMTLLYVIQPGSIEKLKLLGATYLLLLLYAMIDWYTRLYPKHEKMYIPHSESYLMTVRIRIIQTDTFLQEFCLRAGMSEHDVTRGRGQTTSRISRGRYYVSSFSGDAAPTNYSMGHDMMALGILMTITSSDVIRRRHCATRAIKTSKPFICSVSPPWESLPSWALPFSV